MGQSTDAVLAYGWAFEEEYDQYAEETIWDELEPKLEKLGVEWDSHCSGECPMPALIITASKTLACRGSPERIESLDVKAGWDEKLSKAMALVKEAYKDAEYPPEFTSTKAKPGWVLYSMWD